MTGFGTRRRVLPVAGAVAVLAVGLVAVPVAAQPGCVATNVTSGQTSSNLQLILHDAEASDIVQVEGVCVGSFLVTRSATLVGVSSAGTPEATLDGAGAGTVLTVSAGAPKTASVTLVDLRVTGGATVGFGGGVRVDGAALRLQGTTLVDDNAATKGGGVFSASGAVVLQDQATVASNSAAKRGGGIATKGRIRVAEAAVVEFNSAKNGGGVFTNGAAVVTGTASVRDNLARRRGAGISIEDGSLALLGSSAVDGNGSSATHMGGGVYAHESDVVMDDAASVSNNVAERAGGIHAYGDVTLAGSSTVSANHADKTAGGLDVGGQLVMRESASVSQNVAILDGGGIWVHLGATIRGDAALAGNTADRGGAVFTMAPLDILGSVTITGNSASQGAGVFTTYGSIGMGDDVTVSENEATGDGGGIYVGYNSDAVMLGATTISENVAGGRGGGVFVAPKNPEVPNPAPGELVLRDAASVTGNTAVVAGGGIMNLGSVTFGPLWHGTVCGNTPDDWPSCS